MNQGVIIKAECRISLDDDFTDLDIIPYSGNFTEEFSRTDAGGLYSWSGSFGIAKVSETNDTIIDSFAGKKAQFRITDGNGTKHLVGNSSYPSRLTHTREVAASAGGFNGYNCEVTRKAPQHTTIEA